MKKLILICGPNGTGKSTTAAALLAELPRSAYVESDWCRMMNPAQLTDDTAETVKLNIYSMILNYFKCAAIDNVIFPYGFHGKREQIFREIMADLKRAVDFELCPVILTCSESENIRRMRNNGRDEERIARALRNTRNIYDDHEYPIVDTTKMTAEEAAKEILKLYF